MTMAVTLGATGVSYAAYNPDAFRRSAETVAAQVDCRTVNSAIVAYVGVQGRAPKSVAELGDYVKGDISGYRIVRGMAAGPGC